jgi:predicted SAM-dependent methyltransferase
MKPCYINLACGSVFLENSNWINFDYASSSKAVKKVNLLKRLPLEKETADLCYSSHFLEHIPYSQVIDFLSEIFRILKSDGVLRLVLPDLENMASNYVNFRKIEDHKKADFLVIEMIDQCVRNIGGGQLQVFYSKIKKDQDQSMIEFIKRRMGEDLTIYSSQQKHNYNFLSKNFLSILNAIISRIERYWIKIVILVLPSAFRDQNISLAGIGERHRWIWDFYSLKKVLEAVGFVDIKRVSANSSRIKNFPFYPLDVDNEGRPRKGEESMYIEAKKIKYEINQNHNQ